jgi:hypothetical protein
MADRFVGRMATSLMTVSSTRERVASPSVSRSTRVGISASAALSKRLTSDSRLDDVFGDREGLPRPDTSPLDCCRGVECTLLRSEQTSSKSIASAGPASRFLLKV